MEARDHRRDRGPDTEDKKKAAGTVGGALAGGAAGGVAGSALAGAAVGGLTGPAGAAIGAAVGAAGGAAVASGGEEHLSLPAETRLTFNLTAAVTVTP